MRTKEVWFVRCANNEDGNESMQSILLLAVGAMILLGVQMFQRQITPSINNDMTRLLAGTPNGNNGQSNTTANLGGSLDSRSPTTNDNKPKPPKSPIQPTIYQTNEGSFESRSEAIDSDGETTEASQQEQVNNRAAILAAINASESGIAIVGAEHAGRYSPSHFSHLGTRDFDHVMLAYRDPNDPDRIRVAEMLPSGTGFIGRNISSPNHAERPLTEVIPWYDTMTAVPLNGLSADQSRAFLNEFLTQTGPGTFYSVRDNESAANHGETCSSVFGAVMDAIGIKNPISSRGDLNLVHPYEVIEYFENLNKNKSTNLNRTAK